MIDKFWPCYTGILGIVPSVVGIELMRVMGRLSQSKSSDLYCPQPRGDINMSLS